MNVDERFREIYDLTYRMTAARITAKSRQTADAADLIQEVYMELYQILCRRGVFYVKNPNALLTKLIDQTLARYYRRLGGQREIYCMPSADGVAAEIVDIETLSVEEIAEDREILDWINSFLTSRGELVRKIFHLYYRFDLTISEIAVLLDRTESDIKNKLYRTLKEIRIHWKEHKHEVE